MVTIFNLKTTELLENHFDDIERLLNSSPHESVLAKLNHDELTTKLDEVIEAGGMVLKANFSNQGVGLLIAEKRTLADVTVIEFFLQNGSEQRIIDLLFEQCMREIKRQKMQAIYADLNWLQSVEDPTIKNKFFNEK